MDEGSGLQSVVSGAEHLGDDFPFFFPLKGT